MYTKFIGHNWRASTAEGTAAQLFITKTLDYRKNVYTVYLS